jgi:hypothetical protein
MTEVKTRAGGPEKFKGERALSALEARILSHKENDESREYQDLRNGHYELSTSIRKELISDLRAIRDRRELLAGLVRGETWGPDGGGELLEFAEDHGGVEFLARTIQDTGLLDSGLAREQNDLAIGEVRAYADHLLAFGARREGREEAPGTSRPEPAGII